MAFITLCQKKKKKKKKENEILLNITYKNWKICEKPSETNQIN